MNKKRYGKTKILDFLKNQPLITSFFAKNIFGYNKITDSWHCCECGVDMGSQNPRQFCGKFSCDNKQY